MAIYDLEQVPIPSIPPAPTTPPPPSSNQSIPPLSRLPLNFNSSAEEWAAQLQKTLPAFVLDVVHNLFYEIAVAERVDLEERYELLHLHLKNIQLFTSSIHEKYDRVEPDSTKLNMSTPPMQAAAQTSTTPPKIRPDPPTLSSVKKRDPPARTKGKTITFRATSTTKSKPLLPNKPEIRPATSAIVVHGKAVTKRLGNVWKWLEVDNELGTKIAGARWLLKQERREGKVTSFVVVYLEGAGRTSHIPETLCIGGKKYRWDVYEWDRGRKDKGKQVGRSGEDAMETDQESIPR
ncbi:hypothetical protein BDZ91DRAFT_802573 [Kalaharituber pfeilii]|nr:hypothetical protein BDZ91DRAFT_802573 [Kalaharituber pfeilii]